jgi:hypothetical protein
MTKYRIVIRGSHGGELNSVDVVVRLDQEEGEVLKNATIGMLEDCVLAPGDVIMVEVA